MRRKPLPETFQSTHSRRVRPTTVRPLPRRANRFNPRTHEECDRTGTGSSLDTTQFQSTHSRRVRRRKSIGQTNYYRSFNPRTHEECDVTPRVLCSLVWRFQSTHSRRVRQPVNRGVIVQSGFNPRTHEECDLYELLWSLRIILVSIHALTKSATVYIFYL